MDNSQSFFESLPTSVEIQALIERPEDLYFEAKTCKTPLDDGDKDKLAKALSGFANADGGVLIYGLVAKGGDRIQPDVVTALQPVKHLAKTQSEVLSLIGQLVEPPVANVQVVPRPMSRAPERGFVVIWSRRKFWRTTTLRGISTKSRLHQGCFALLRLPLSPAAWSMGRSSSP